VMLNQTYSKLTADLGKQANKKELCDRFGLDIEKPLIVFIGR